MLKPKFITFTGLDAKTDRNRLKELSARYPVEWGILFSKKNQGNANRYPALADILPFLGEGLALSAHLCGRYAMDLMEKGTFPDISDLLEDNFRRTQINVADGETDVQTVRVETARAFVQRIGAERGIIQCRDSFPMESGVDWLFDRSGGAGVLPESWDARAGMAPGFCGYAGGISAENVVAVLARIEATHPAEKPFWIDMEGRVRDAEDWLDLDRCEAVLRAVYGEGEVMP